MRNLIFLPVPDVIDHTLQIRSGRFHTGIAFLHKVKCYQQINSLTYKGIIEPCRSWVHWFTGQHRLRLKSASPIAENCLNAGTKLKIEQFLKTLEGLNKSFVFKHVNRPIAILLVAVAECLSMQCFWPWSQQTGKQQTLMQASVIRLVPPSPFAPMANVANSEILNHPSFSNTEIRPEDPNLIGLRLVDLTSRIICTNYMNF
jgi:hypothetical protein